ncbi:hypothetical protein OAO01_04290 [Oligoflexia bacterium]|nr:hypothetical protein [Oligoflexia bacterium]
MKSKLVFLAILLVLVCISSTPVFAQQIPAPPSQLSMDPDLCLGAALTGAALELAEVAEAKGLSQEKLVYLWEDKLQYLWELGYFEYLELLIKTCDAYLRTPPGTKFFEQSK